jgi:hypothetical protein
VGALDGLKALAKAPTMASPAMEEGDDESEDPKMAAVTPAAEDLLAAIKAGDQGGVADAAHRRERSGRGRLAARDARPRGRGVTHGAQR